LPGRPTFCTDHFFGKRLPPGIIGRIHAPCHEGGQPDHPDVKHASEDEQAKHQRNQAVRGLRAGHQPLLIHAVDQRACVRSRTSIGQTRA
jgi:hypothetical protein